MPYTPNYAAGDVLTAAAMNSIGEAWSSFGTTANFKAVTTNPTLGTGGTWSMLYSQVNKLVTVRGRITWGGASRNLGSGKYRIDLPVTAKTGHNQQIGTAIIVDVLALAYGAQVLLSSTTQASIWFPEINGTLSTIWLTELGSADAPFTFGDGDYIDYTFTYEAA